MHYVNYIKHSLSTPDTYHRSFENDFPEGESVAKRVALVALPFVGLYQPAGAVLSLGMGGCRVVTHIAALFEDPSLAELGQMALASLALVSSIFNYSVGLFVTSLFDTLASCYDLDFLQALGNGLYLAFMVMGVLEYMLCFALVQVVISLIQARGEIAGGRYLEAAAKIVMGGIRLQQAHGYYMQIQRRDALYALMKYQALIERAERGRVVRGLIEHPLSDIDEGYYHAFGKQLVKGENLTIREKGDMIELDFKVNHVFREKIQRTIEELGRYDRSEMREILHFTGSHATDIRVEKGTFFEGQFSETHKIQLVGIGTIMIGSSPHTPNLYDRVVVQLPKGATLFDFHEMMAFMDLDEALELSTVEDIERLKLGHLYRIFFPEDATPLERTAGFFSLPLTELKERIFAKTPGMREIYDNYFHRMVPEEIFPGKIRYRVVGLADEAYEMGARAMTAAITGAYTEAEIFERVAMMLRMGMMSTESRYENDISKHGISPSADFWTGGADSVYTQMITERDCRNKTSFDDFAYDSEVRFIIKLDALEMGTYQYLWDSFGTRGGGTYWSRPGILEFIRERQNGRWFYSSHEVMFKERIPPSFFQCMVVKDQKTQAKLTKYLRDREIDIPENFIRVATTVSEVISG